jgi:hypothetical protein
VTNIRRFCRSLLLPALLIGGLPGLQVTEAAGIEGTWIQQDTAPPPPAADLSGWFFNGDSQFLYPLFPDPSQIWSSAENIAILNSWAGLVGAAAGDPLLLAQLTGLGMTGSSTNSLSDVSLATSQQVPGNVPEPDLLGLAGCALALLGFYALAQVRPMSAVGSRSRPPSA